VRGGGVARFAKNLILQKIYGERPPIHIGMDRFFNKQVIRGA
jgi:hypothetical protein